jgi:hypothetical protein
MHSIALVTSEVSLERKPRIGLMLLELEAQLTH